MKRPAATILLAASALSGCASGPAADNAALAAQVTAAERAFADSMARRDFAAFQRFLADDAVFYGPAAAQRGKAEVAGFWKQYFNGQKAPFSWAPDRVDVLESGLLAYSSGPVHDAEGRLIARFNSVWRQEAPGQWKVVFDKGEPVCNPAASARQ
ncbi:nuclear transport factor 2 family protein [Pseudoduganella sp. SL102]|uniref:YybH family protein n=1 Tax=Pseudoduganella sp. SL102 TaxID=2995154 RepID=UPI00248CECC5|nr:nuclear transport factor 2 family protein [Pseudoduganella sp. SL102]WBR99881.1 nuclear transport factor 2 family protein [Pseudoduganella sp. SL102]